MKPNEAVNQLRLGLQVVCNTVSIEDLCNIFIELFDTVQLEIPKMYQNETYYIV